MPRLVEPVAGAGGDDDDDPPAGWVGCAPAAAGVVAAAGAGAGAVECLPCGLNLATADPSAAAGAA